MRIRGELRGLGSEVSRAAIRRLLRRRRIPPALPREVSAVFPVFLRGGPELVGDAKARLVDEREAAAVIEREAKGGTLVRFHLTGDYVLIDGQERRVYDFDSPRSG